MKNNKSLILVGITIIFLLGILFIPRFLNDKNSFKTIDLTKVNKKQFAMYKQNDEGKYEEITNTNKIPEGYTLNKELTYCLDNNGDKVENIFNFVNGKITVTSNKTVYCTLYFDIEEPQETSVYWTYEGTNVGTEATGYAAPHKVSDYRNLNVYRRLDTSYDIYYVYPTSAQATCESDNGGESCESLVQPYFIKETSRSVTATEPIYEVQISMNGGNTYSTYGYYTEEEYAAELSSLGVELACDGIATNLGGTYAKCITHDSGYTYMSNLTYEVCGNINGTVICMKETDWENSETLKSQFEAAGLTCAYNNGTKSESSYLVCTDEDPTNGYSLGGFECNVYSIGFAVCRVAYEGICRVGGGGAECEGG